MVGVVIVSCVVIINKIITDNVDRIRVMSHIPPPNHSLKTYMISLLVVYAEDTSNKLVRKLKQNSRKLTSME